MVEDKNIREQIETALGNMAQRVPDFRPREGQVQMIEECAKTLLGEYGGAPIIVAEGPTGTGKTLAYLISAIPVAQALEKKVVISSATVALQEQLIERDIPNMQKHSGLQFTYAVAKGRGRYLCKSNLDLLTGNHPDQGQLFDGEELGVWTFRPEDADIQRLYKMHEDYAVGRWDGCRDSLEGAMADDLWNMVTSNSHSCLGKNCRNYRQCALVRARWELAEVDVIVVNHDLVLSYLALEQDTVLSSPEETIYIFDEGHHLPRKAISHFAASTTLRGMNELVDRLAKLLPRYVAVMPPGTAGDKEDRAVQAITRDLERALEHFREAVEHLPYAAAAPGEALYRAPLGQVPVPVRDLAADIREDSAHLYNLLAGMKERLTAAVEKGEVTAQMAEGVLPDLGWLTSRAEQAARLWTLMSEEDAPRQPPKARWIVKTEKDYRVEASPITAADTLRRKLWSRCAGAVVTSATLRAVGTFDRFRAKAGLRRDDGTQFCAIPSPFDFEKNGVLYVPWMRSDGSQHEAHTREIATMLPRLVERNLSALVLFSSWRQMREVLQGLPPKLRKQVLLQGEMSKSALLEEHAQRVSKGKPSYIFGVDSMAEGVDLRGNLCEHVIIAKLPFTVPDSPIESTQAEWLESIGGNPFLQLAVPEASLKLIQAAGRLIRTETDRGQVTILDRRIVTKRYGGMLLNSLPPFRRVIEERPTQVANG